MRPFETIRSTQNPSIKRLAKLRRGRFRRREGSFIVDGLKEIQLALDAGLICRGIYEAVDEGDKPIGSSTRMSDRLCSIRERLIDVYHPVLPQPFAKISRDGPGSVGLVAEFERPDESIARLSQIGTGLILILDRIEKPGNIGAIFRTADAVGAAAVLLCDCAGDRFSPIAIRNSRGAVFCVPSASGGIFETHQFLERSSVSCVAMRVEGATSVYQFDFSLFKQALAIVVGSESDGLGDRWRFQPNGQSRIPRIFIPMAGKADSLNVSVSAALASFEYLRQRETGSTESEQLF